MTGYEIKAFRAFVEGARNGIEGADMNEDVVASLTAEDADDMMEAMLKAAELLEDWYAAEEAHDQYFEDRADAASY